MSNLYIDIGNTAVKWLFDGEYSFSLAGDFDLSSLPKASNVYVSSVGDKSILDGLDNVVFVQSQSNFPNFTSAYKNPKDLGVDRFLAMIASVHKYPSENILAIDAGSALTFDLITANGRHQGGLIMPGLNALRSTFAKFSSNEQSIVANSLADNTKDAWSLGTLNMFLSAVNGQIEKHLANYGALRIVLTGGDRKILALKLQHKVEVEPNLVLDGLKLYVDKALV